MDIFDIVLASKREGGGGGGVTPAIKTALLACFSKVAWVDENGQDYWNTLKNALYSTAGLDSISAVYSGGSVAIATPLDDLKNNLVVTASWSDGSTSTVDSLYYELSGTLVVGSNTITVTYLEATTTFNVTATIADFEVGSIGKAITSGANYRYAWKEPAAARARMTAPVLNKNYVFTVTDSSKYNITVYDPESLETTQRTVQGRTVDAYYCGTKSVSWTTIDSVTTDYVWVALKKMDGTEFTDAELANGAAAVFTYTES